MLHVLHITLPEPFVKELDWHHTETNILANTVCHIFIKILFICLKLIKILQYSSYSYPQDWNYSIYIYMYIYDL